MTSVCIIVRFWSIIVSCVIKVSYVLREELQIIKCIIQID